MDPLATSIFPAPSRTFLGHCYPHGNQVTVMRTADVSPGARGAPSKLPIEHEHLTKKTMLQAESIFIDIFIGSMSLVSVTSEVFIESNSSNMSGVFQKTHCKIIKNNGKENVCA